ARPSGTKSPDARSASAKASERRSVEVRPPGAKPSDVKAAEAKAAEAKAAEAKAAEAKVAEHKAITKPPRIVGLSANELSTLYTTAARELGALPKASVHDLWSRWLLIKIQDLMAAPQAKRDDAARQLWEIHQEADRRK